MVQPGGESCDMKESFETLVAQAGSVLFTEDLYAINTTADPRLDDAEHYVRKTHPPEDNHKPDAPAEKKKKSVEAKTLK
eukprot:267525-Rhodomonas_salina.1